ncbi:hypothetical protein J2T56_001720 [Natronobacillus azotifigens]|uniref:DUF4153 domain-containing protein n=1 Tax=Natronobacillus azotifigens TaxID=472978 RepID=A0A9J6RD93_9BACI|nr:DUF4153 domain-containing protein [Natronobacillus azotifigens]
MKVFKWIRGKFTGILEAARRYPLTVGLLVILAAANAFAINDQFENYRNYITTLIVGACLGLVGQQVYERFFTRKRYRLLLLGGAFLLMLGYYWGIVRPATSASELSSKTSIAFLALLFVFIWIPTIRHRIHFNNSFMAAFKGLFTTILFTIIIIAGISAIIMAVDLLLFSVDYSTIPHMINVTLTLFAPIFFLSFIPLYQGGKGKEEKVKQATDVPKNLSVLLSYVIIPITVVYTFILVLYILLNIGGDLWTESLLESLLISFAITVLIVYVLASNIENKMTYYFQKIFPKILVPIVIFQTIASVMMIEEEGLTHGRYYVIMFGFFATIIGIIFSFFSKKIGLIAPILIIFAWISIVPPTDAFTISRVNHVNRLDQLLINHDMRANESIIADVEIPVKDQVEITNLVRYLDRMGYAEDVVWLPNNLFYSNRFEETFGFEPRDGIDQPERTERYFAYLEWNPSDSLSISQYDWMLHQQIDRDNEEQIEIQLSDQSGNSYTILREQENEFFWYRLKNSEEELLIEFDGEQLFDTIFDRNGSGQNRQTLSINDATIVHENEDVRMKFLIESISMHNDTYDAEFSIFIEFK